MIYELISNGVGRVEMTSQQRACTLYLFVLSFFCNTVGSGTMRLEKHPLWSLQEATLPCFMSKSLRSFPENVSVNKTWQYNQFNCKIVRLFIDSRQKLHGPTLTENSAFGSRIHFGRPWVDMVLVERNWKPDRDGGRRCGGLRSLKINIFFSFLFEYIF